MLEAVIAIPHSRADEALNFISGAFRRASQKTGAIGRLPGMVEQMNTSKPKIVEIKKKGKTNAAKRKAETKRGSVKLREAANRVMGRDSKKLAEALAENGKKGQLQSIKFMYEISDDGAEDDEMTGAQKVQSMALRLASAPQWTGPLPTEDDDEDGDTP
jgi:hypothetical protein